eukprot:SAG11_NODE_3902_length_2157_cov_1.282313_2_plen_137_part_00
MALTFTDDCGGGVTELVGGGGQMPVTQDNHSQYIRCFVRHRLEKCIQPQIEAFRRGFRPFFAQSYAGSISLVREFISPADLQVCAHLFFKPFFFFFPNHEIQGALAYRNPALQISAKLPCSLYLLLAASCGRRAHN